MPDPFGQIVSRFSAYPVALAAIAIALGGDVYDINLGMLARTVLLVAGIGLFIVSCLANFRASFKADGTYSTFGQTVSAIANASAMALLIAMVIGAFVARTNADDDRNPVTTELVNYLDLAKTPNADLTSASFKVVGACQHADKVSDLEERAITLGECKSLLGAALSTDAALNSLTNIHSR